jgi:alpha-galactosidase
VLGQEAVCVIKDGDLRVYEKKLEDGSHALGFFNLGSTTAKINFDRLASLSYKGKLHVRDVWRQGDLPDVDAANGVLPLTIPAHGVLLYKLTAAN